VNLLPRDGIVTYSGRVFPQEESATLFDDLLATSPWQPDEVILFGRKHDLSRKVAWMGDVGFTYSYSGTSKTASPWTAPVLSIRERVASLCNREFNSCLLNLYHDGSEGMGWHSDDERTLGTNPVIASVSFGAERPFRFKHRVTREVIPVTLENGSLLVMAGPTQHHWLHTLPKSRRVTIPRINLTFRHFLPAESRRGKRRGSAKRR
jgi:alkylated DNA repair dioxygenase AlkB